VASFSDPQGPQNPRGPQSPQNPPDPEVPEGSGAAVPTCYRHPGRETYVSCIRCDRPACPECLRSAAVGQQCVECIREAGGQTRRPAGAFGGQLVSGAVVTWILVGINVVCYLAELLFQNAVLGHGIMFGAGVADGQLYRLITNTFLHEPPGSGIGLLHIAFNMWALIVVGPALERMLGRVRFVTVYVVSALGGSVLYYLVAPPFSEALGASGAIFGLFAAWFVLARRLRLDSRQIVMLIVINLVITFAVSGIAWEAHVGGLIAGGALTAAYAYAPRANRTLIQVAATAVVVAILIIGVVVRDTQLVGAVRL
jgi:membrane associated rhomboid family serine protease